MSVENDSAPRAGKQEQVRDRLQQLMSGLQPGEMLPSERELAARLGVARMTLRRAVDGLVNDHQLVRRAGAGTFMAPARVDQRLSATSFSTDMRSRGLVPGAKTFSAQQRPAGMMLASVLGIEPNSPVLHVRRVRTADDEPMALEDLHVPADLVPGLAGADLEDNSFYDILRDRYDLVISGGIQTVEAHQVDADEASHLDVDPGSPAFLFERTSRLSSGRAVEFVRSVYRGDRYRIVVDIFPTAGDGRHQPERTSS
ncbi:GntR family transcriptional regulator [Ornithinimicrobium sp. Y1694]|uniref:GntR family transcriptional regulator n=1 Tax=Ornithinimicrobium sp. Y1694 TaxID=3418590 RepID=UPI003CE98568